MTKNQPAQCQKLGSMSLVMRKPDFCICENKDADQLRSNCAADQRLCFSYIDSTIPLLPKSDFLAFSHLLWLYSPVCVGPGRKPRRPVFSQRGSFGIGSRVLPVHSVNHMSPVVRKRSSGFPTWSDTNRAAQLLNKASHLKFWI